MFVAPQILDNTESKTRWWQLNCLEKFNPESWGGSWSNLMSICFRWTRRSRRGCISPQHFFKAVTQASKKWDYLPKKGRIWEEEFKRTLPKRRKQDEMTWWYVVCLDDVQCSFWRLKGFRVFRTSTLRRSNDTSMLQLHWGYVWRGQLQHSHQSATAGKKKKRVEKTGRAGIKLWEID